MYIQGNGVNISNIDINKTFAPFLKKDPLLLEKLDIYIREEPDKKREQSNPIQDIQKQAHKISKKLLAAEITGGSIVITGLAIAALTRKNSGNLSEIFVDLNRRINLKFDQLSRKTQKTFLEKAYFKTVEWTKITLNTLGNFNEIKGFVIETKLRNNVNKKEGFIRKNIKKILQKNFDFLVNATEKAAIKKYSRLSKSNTVLLSNLDEIIKRFESHPKLKDEAEIFKGLKVKIEAEINKLVSDFAEIINSGENKANKEILKKERLDKLHKNLDELTNRYSKYLEGLFPSHKTETILNGVKEFSKDQKHFISRELKEETGINYLSRNIFNLKEIISRSLEDKLARINHTLNHIDENLIAVGFNDKNIFNKNYRDLIKDIKNIIREYDYNKDAKIPARVKNELNSLIQKLEDDVKNIINNKDFNNNNILKVNKELLEKSIIELKHVKNNLDSKQGLLQDLKDELKNHEGIIDSALYNKLTGNIGKVSRDLRNAVNFEAESLPDRLIELYLGGGIETFTNIIPFLLLGEAVRKKKTKEEKVDTALKLGLPLVGGLGVWFYQSVIECMNGPRALLFGVITGLLLNKAGDMIGDSYTKRLHSQQGNNNTKQLTV